MKTEIRKLLKQINEKGLAITAEEPLDAYGTWKIYSHQNSKENLIFEHKRAIKTAIWLHGFLTGLQFQTQIKI